jgi:hypothetical protein
MIEMTSAAPCCPEMPFTPSGLMSVKGRTLSSGGSIRSSDCFSIAALRDEGTSYHYAPPSEFADASPELVSAAAEAVAMLNKRSVVGHKQGTPHGPDNSPRHSTLDLPARPERPVGSAAGPETRNVTQLHRE